MHHIIAHVAAVSPFAEKLSLLMVAIYEKPFYSRGECRLSRSFSIDRERIFPTIWATAAPQAVIWKSALKLNRIFMTKFIARLLYGETCLNQYLTFLLCPSSYRGWHILRTQLPHGKRRLNFTGHALIHCVILNIF